MHSIPVSKSRTLDHKLDALVNVTFNKHLVDAERVFNAIKLVVHLFALDHERYIRFLLSFGRLLVQAHDVLAQLDSIMHDGQTLAYQDELVSGVVVLPAPPNLLESLLRIHHQIMAQPVCFKLTDDAHRKEEVVLND